MIIGTILYIILGVIVMAAGIAITIQILSLMTPMHVQWEDFYTYFKYAFVFSAVAMTVYACIASDIIGMGIQLIREIFNK